ncbi:MAG: hypothetical protein K0U38_01465 [Epsilonproteobacteria bacterium]|nr:hypothetical protein [Campylobacterota bacterium]
MNLTTVKDYVEINLSKLLSSMFDGIDFRDRFSVTRELDIWKAETEELWNIKKGNQAETFNVLFDDEVILSFSEDNTPAEVRRMFLEGFLDAYEDERVYLNKEMYEERAKKEAQEKMIREAQKEERRRKDLEKLSKEEKEIANIVLDEVEKDKGHASAS